MPRLFKIAGYAVYFWTNEGTPPESVHVHISAGHPNPNATKIWLTSDGKSLLAHNNSKIPQYFLNRAMEVIEARADEILGKWKEIFGEVKFYC